MSLNEAVATWDDETLRAEMSELSEAAGRDIPGADETRRVVAQEIANRRRAR
jgi:hypothetical protein